MAGGLVGRMYGGTYSKCYATGNVTAERYAGGLLGYSDSSIISDCFARGSATADPVSGYFAGGLIGRSASDNVDNCYSTGAARDSDGYAGGLVGDNVSSTITNCFWDTETSGNATSDGGTGKTTAQMKTESTFTDPGWDFTTPIWYINATINDGYPAFTTALKVLKGNPNLDQRIYRHVERMGR